MALAASLFMAFAWMELISGEGAPRQLAVAIIGMLSLWIIAQPTVR